MDACVLSRPDTRNYERDRLMHRAVPGSWIGCHATDTAYPLLLDARMLKRLVGHELARRRCPMH